MWPYVSAFAIALFAWWFSTGVILYLNHLEQRTYRWSMFGAGGLMIASLFGLIHGSQDPSQFGAILAFVQALLVWAWLEMSYFMGLITGSRKTACPPDAKGLRRFRLALQTSLHHELAVVGLGALIILSTWDAPNRVGAATFLTLWLMRWSAKLNLFLGVPNVNAEWLPISLRFLTSYMRRRPMNLFFPLVVTGATGLATLLFLGAVSTNDEFTRTAYALIASLLSLAILEHWFLVLPLHDSVLWDWALKLARKGRLGSAKVAVNGDDAHRQAIWRRRTDGFT